MSRHHCYYRLGVPCKVPENIQNRIDKAAELVNIKKYERNFIESFMVSGFDVADLGEFLSWMQISCWSDARIRNILGCLRSKYCGWVGVPVNYTYRRFDDIDKAEILLCLEKIKWSSEPGKLLEKSLVLTEDEQIFSFSKALLEMQSWKMGWNALTPTISLLSVYGITTSLNSRYNLFKAQRAVSVV